MPSSFDVEVGSGGPEQFNFFAGRFPRSVLHYRRILSQNRLASNKYLLIRTTAS